MEKQKIVEMIKAFICEKLAADSLEEDQNLNEFTDFDSMLLVELILYLEETFLIEVPEELYDMDNFETINKIACLTIKCME